METIRDVQMWVFSKTNNRVPVKVQQTLIDLYRSVISMIKIEKRAVPCRHVGTQ